MSKKKPSASDTTEQDQLDSISVELKKAREARGLSFSDIHRITGISRTTLHDYESGRSKPGAREIVRLCEPLELSPNRLLLGSETVYSIARCRDNVISKHLLHHSTHAGRAKPEDKTPPTFHEIRSLAARLYADQGIDAQALLGHKSADMTAIYRDVRGAEWIEAKTA